MEAMEITMEAVHVQSSAETVRQNVTMMLLAVAKKSTALRMDNVKTTVEFGLILLVVGLASPATKHMVETEISTEATEITMEAALPCQATRIITTRTRLQVTHSTPSTRLHLTHSTPSTRLHLTHSTPSTRLQVTHSPPSTRLQLTLSTPSTHLQ